MNIAPCAKLSTPSVPRMMVRPLATSASKDPEGEAVERLGEQQGYDGHMRSLVRGRIGVTLHGLVAHTRSLLPLMAVTWFWTRRGRSPASHNLAAVPATEAHRSLSVRRELSARQTLHGVRPIRLVAGTVGDGTTKKRRRAPNEREVNMAQRHARVREPCSGGTASVAARRRAAGPAACATPPAPRTSRRSARGRPGRGLHGVRRLHCADAPEPTRCRARTS